MTMFLTSDGKPFYGGTYFPPVDSGGMPGFARVLLGVAAGDEDADAAWMAEKVVDLRIFADDQGKMNRSLSEVHGEMLVVSQFTLWGDCRKGRRPRFTSAAPPELAEPLYELLAHERGSGRRERQDWRAAQVLRERTERQIGGPEIVSPLRHAVRFVYDQQRDRRVFHLLFEGLAGRALGRDPVSYTHLTLPTRLRV